MRARSSLAVSLAVLVAAGAAGAATVDDARLAGGLPAVTITAPADGTATNDTTPTIAGTAGTAAGDAPTVRLQIRSGTGGGQPVRTLTAAVEPATGTWSVDVEPELAEGTYNVKATQSGAGGGEAESTRHVFTVDVTAPAAPAVTGPSGRTRATSAEISFAHEEEGVTFLCRLDAGAEAPCTSPATYAGLADGGHAVEVRARDAAGNAGAAGRAEWTVDTTPPAVVLTSPANGSITSDSAPVVRGTAGTALGDLPTVQVDVWPGSAPSGPALRSLTASVNPVTGAWSVPVAPALAQGTYTARAQQADDLGNSAQTPATTFTIDVAAAAVAVATPAHGTVTRDRFPRFSGTSDRASVVLEVYAGPVAAGAPARSVTVAVAGGQWSVTLEAPLPDGVYTAVARATNTAGATSTSNAAGFVVDDTPPSFTSVPANMTLEQTALAGEAVAYAVAAADGLDPAPDVVCSPPSGARFPRGTTTVTCTVTDWVGLTTQASFTVTVRNTLAPAPVAGFTARAGNGVVHLSWRRPTEWDRDRVVVRRAVRGSSTWKVVLDTRTATSFTDRGVANDREYVYRATSVDVARNVSSPAVVTARPSAFLAPAWGAVVSSPPVLRWAAVPGASYYNVQLWRNGRKVLSRWPTEPRFALTGTWMFQGRRHTLQPGTYTAYAWPGFGPKAQARYGRLVGWTKFVVR